MDALTKHVKGEMECNPEVLDMGEGLSVAALPIEARRWHKAAEIVAVVADLKGSTNLGVGKHAASTAAIYEASTGGITRIFNELGADYVAIQGDGAVGLFWGAVRMERALCAGITIKSFSEDILVPKLTKKWPELPPTGLKVGVAVSSVLVKRVGVPRTDLQEPVWAGKAVNYATKAAQQAEAHEMIVSGSIWDFVETNDYLAVTCPCGNGPSASLWSDVMIDKIHEGDGERAGRRLTSKWCPNHGAEYCAAILAGETTRPEASAIGEVVKKSQRSNQLRAFELKRREAKRNERYGLGRVGR
jgi:class 3 adenylate cyclase